MTERNPSDLAAENERLRAEVVAVSVERDAYRIAYLQEAERSDPGFTVEDFENGVPTGPWFEEFLENIENGDSDPGRCFPWRIAP